MSNILTMLAVLCESPKKLTMLRDYMEKLVQMADEVDGFTEEEHTEMRLGNRITAVKLIRERKSLGLREAVELVDPYMKANGWFPLLGLKVIMYSPTNRHGDLTVECKSFFAVKCALAEWFYTDRPDLPSDQRKPMAYSSWKVFIGTRDESESYKDWFRSTL